MEEEKEQEKEEKWRRRNGEGMVEEENDRVEKEDKEHQTTCKANPISIDVRRHTHTDVIRRDIFCHRSIVTASATTSSSPPADV